MLMLDFFRKKLSGFFDLLPLRGVVFDIVAAPVLSRNEADGVAGLAGKDA